MGKLDFFWEYFRHPRQMGTFTESSGSLIEAVVNEMRGLHIVELGAGRGPVTRGILDRLPGDGTLTAFEINPRLYRHLARINDSRLTTILGNAENFEAYVRDVDCIISGLPLTSLRRGVRSEILTKCKKYPLFIQYKYADSRRLLEQYFSSVTTIREIRNIPPAYVYVCSNDRT